MLADTLERTRRAIPQTLKQLREADIPMVSAALAFSTLLSLIPFLAVALVALKSFGGLEILGAKFEAVIFSFLNDTAGAEAGQLVRKLLKRLTTRSLGFTSAAVLFLTGMSLFLDVENAINRIWGTRRERKWWRRLSLIMGFYFLVPFGLAVYAVVRSLAALQPVVRWNPMLWDTMLAFCILLALNRWAPARKIPWKVALVGAGVSTVGLAILQGSFTWLTKTAFNYSKMYGSVAALPLLCLWILLAWQIILFGVAFSATLESPIQVSLRRRRGSNRGTEPN